MMTETAQFRPRARAPRGFRDRRGPALAIERRILGAVAEVFESFGFEALETAGFEYADALGKFLPDDDRPNVGVFSLRDDDEQWLALRYDLTAPLARFVAENREGLPRPFRRYAFGPVWRNEKSGPGRDRQFTQCDADTIGSDRPEADAEMIAMAAAAYAAAGLPADAVVLKANSRKLLNGLLAAAGVDAETQRLAVLRAVDKLDRLGRDGVAALLGGGRLDESGAFTVGAGLDVRAIDSVLAFVGARRESRAATLDAIAGVIGGSAEGEAGLEELAAIGVALVALGVGEKAAVFDPSVVRGLEYYTGAVFEAELTAPIAGGRGEPLIFGSIGGGGRYDDLVSRFTGERTPATGFSVGVSRLAAAIEAGGGPGGREASRGPVVVIAFDRARMANYFTLAGELRAAGIPAEVYLGAAGLRAQMKYADRRLAPAAVMLGDDEIAAGTVTIKDLDLGRALAAGVEDHGAWRAERPGQVTVARGDFVGAVAQIAGRTACPLS